MSLNNFKAMMRAEERLAKIIRNVVRNLIFRILGKQKIAS